jgi:hypothetical protein
VAALFEKVNKLCSDLSEIHGQSFPLLEVPEMPQKFVGS